MRLANAESVTNHGGEQADLEVYADNDQIGDWAREAMRTAIREGLVTGYGNELRPKKSLTRSETAALLYRMLLQAGFIDGKR